MKPLALAALSALLLLPGALQAQVKQDPSDSLKELKKKYARGGQKPEAPAPAPASVSLKPALYARLAKGPAGYSLKELTDNLNWTDKNIGALTNYIRPWREGETAPEGEDAAWAHRQLAAESAAARDLIADADAALAKGVPRDPKDPRYSGLRPIISYLSRPSIGYMNPTPEQRLQSLALAQANVLGHSAALIEYKRLNPPDEKGEGDTDGWLRNAREHLAAVEKR